MQGTGQGVRHATRMHAMSTHASARTAGKQTPPPLPTAPPTAALQVVQRRSSRLDQGDVFFTAVLPRKDRANRCCTLLTELLPGGCLRDAISHGALFPGGWTPQVRLRPLQPEDWAAAATAGGDEPVTNIISAGNLAVASPPPRLELLRLLLLQVAQGMAFLHNQGIVHGELRSDNIMLEGSLPPDEHDPFDAGGAAGAGAGAAVSPFSAAAGTAPSFCLKIKDIGMCQASVVNRTLTVRKLVQRSRLHAAACLPPEAFRGEPLSKAGDAYAFGLLMWELYTGQVGGSLGVSWGALVPQRGRCWLRGAAAAAWGPGPSARC